MSIDYNKARRLLARRDPALRDLMRRHDACGLAGAQHEDPFKAPTYLWASLDTL